ncbi:MAG: phage/plasmid primase, P4 family, partial [Verrucomicrobiota bacterium]|nr:phage/plasmid primase, P4 family [Verrucomicrobiota bacterium]
DDPTYSRSSQGEKRDDGAPETAEANACGEVRLKDVMVSLNGKPTAPSNIKDEPLLKLLDDIKVGRWKREADAVRAKFGAAGGGSEGKKAVRQDKQEMPMICWSARLAYRANDGLIRHSGIVCADIDLVPDLAVARSTLEADAHVLVVYSSITGTGLKVLFPVHPIPIADREHKAAFAAVGEYLAKLGLGVFNDTGTGDVSRGQTVSYDADLHVNYRAVPIKWLMPADRPRAAAQRTQKPDKETIRDILAVIPRRPDYDDWIKIAAAVGDALPFDQAIEVLREWSPEECPGEYAEKLRHRLDHVTVGTLIHIAREHGWRGEIRLRSAVGKGGPAPEHGGGATNSPANWFAGRFPQLPDEFGVAILEGVNKDGMFVVKDFNEPFLAATLSARAVPEAPTVFISAEERFYTYVPSEGIFREQRKEALLTRLSSLLLEAARACPGCATRSLEFRFRDSSSLTGVLNHARGILAEPPDFFANDLTEFIPCSNGMLRLSDRTLRPFSPAYRRRNKLAVSYDPSAKCPLFLDKLMRPALTADYLDLLQRWCGLALIGDNLAQGIVILIGTAGGGKGTFIRVLQGVIGAANVGGLRTQFLGERFELGRALGKTLLYGADVPENFLNHRGASVLKSLTGADPVPLEFKNSNEAPSIICRFNIVVTCNSRLTVHLEGDIEAWRRRLVIIEYRNPAPREKVANLSDIILRDEAAGVLNWMLDGLDKIRADGWQLHLTSGQQKVVDDLLLESDSHGVFAREALVRDKEGNLTIPDCYAAYVDFCTERNWAALAKNKFSSAIADSVVRQFGMTVRHDVPDQNEKPQRGWTGIRCR